MTTTKKRIPAVLTGHALQSLRDSGYSLAAAVGEVIDNSVEADANNIRVWLEEATDPRGKNRIHQIAVLDDGEGMNTDVLSHYLQLGYSTRYMSRTTIGKYGVGAKLAALNFGTRIDVWSRTSASEPWLHTYFDLSEALADEQRGEDVYLPEPSETPVPPEYEEEMPNGAGTIVVWSNVDRLEEGRRAPDANALRVEIEKELSRMFRNFLEGGIGIWVNGTGLLPHDPLWLMDGSFADAILHKYYKTGAGAELADALGFPWALKADKTPPDHFAAELIADEKFEIAGSAVRLRVTLYPREITRKRGIGGDKLATKLRVADNEGAISFIRLDREINYTNVPRIFPSGVENADRFIGIEVSFTPELDEYFGVRNVKRGVEPHDALRAKIRKALTKYVPESRAKLQQAWGDAARESKKHEGEHGDIVDAAAEANRTLPKSRAKGPEDEVEEQRILDDLARDVGKTDEQEREEYLDRISSLPFVVESVDFPGNQFVDVQHLSHQVIIRLNTRHRFYREMWEPIREIAEASPGSISGSDANRAARRTIEALTLLLIAYGKAESMHENPREEYDELRSYWGQFLGSLMGRVRGVA